MPITRSSFLTWMPWTGVTGRPVCSGCHDPAVVERDVDARLGAEEQQSLALGILANRAREVVGRNAADDLRPALAVVRRLVDVGRAVGPLIPVAGQIRGARIVRRRVDQADARERRQIRRRDVRPRLSAVTRHVHDAVIGARPDDAAVDGRRREGEDRRVGFDARLIERDRPARRDRAWPDRGASGRG